MLAGRDKRILYQTGKELLQYFRYVVEGVGAERVRGWVGWTYGGAISAKNIHSSDDIRFTRHWKITKLHTNNL